MLLFMHTELYNCILCSSQGIAKLTLAFTTGKFCNAVRMFGKFSSEQHMFIRDSTLFILFTHRE